MAEPVYARMSKSRGNGIGVDETVHQVHSILPGYEFRDEQDRILDWNDLGVWKNPVDSMFCTASRRGTRPVFLCQAGNPIPPSFRVCDRVVVQHESSPWWDVPELVTITRLELQRQQETP